MSLYPDFFDSVRSLYQSHQLRKVTSLDFDKVAPVLQVVSQGCVLTYGIWLISYVKSQKSTKCAVYTVHFYTWSDLAESHQQHAKSHQLRTMNARGHINSVP